MRKTRVILSGATPRLARPTQSKDRHEENGVLRSHTALNAASSARAAGA